MRRNLLFPASQGSKSSSQLTSDAQRLRAALLQDPNAVRNFSFSEGLLNLETIPQHFQSGNAQRSSEIDSPSDRFGFGFASDARTSVETVIISPNATPLQSTPSDVSWLHQSRIHGTERRLIPKSDGLDTITPRQTSRSNPASMIRHSRSPSPSAPRMEFRTYAEGNACARCNHLHRYSEALCTMKTDTEGRECPPLSAKEELQRHNIKYELGIVPFPFDHKFVSPLCAKCDGFIEPFTLHTCDQSKATRKQGQEAELRRARDAMQSQIAHLRPSASKSTVAETSTSTSIAPSGMAAILAKVRELAAAPSKVDRTLKTKSVSTAPSDSHMPSKDAHHQTLAKEIKAARANLESLEAAQFSQSRPVKPLTKTAKLEAHKRKEQAQATAAGDKKELKQLKQSRTIRKSEAISEDDEQDARQEVKKTILHHNLFNPTKRKSLTTKHGYFDAEYIDDDEEEEVDDAGDDEEDDDQGDPDYEQTNSVTPSPSRKDRVTLTRKEYTALMAQLKTPQALPIIQTLMRTAESPARDQHGRRLDDGGPNRLISRQEAPSHGTWNDIAYLTSTFTDEYDMYVRRCGKGSAFDSIWECYNPTAQSNIVKHITADDENREEIESHINSLTNAEFVDLLCSKMGLNYPKETETELRKNKLVGSYLVRDNWVSLQTQWEKVLKRVTPKGALLPKKVASIFASMIEDNFIRDWLLSKDSKSWTQSWQLVVSAIADSHWLIGYMLEKDKEPPAKEHKQQSKQPAGAAPAQPATSAPAHFANPKAHSTSPASGPFDPLTFKNKSGKVNVNPNLKQKMPNLNPNRDDCGRCDYIHNFAQEHCTSEKKKSGELCEPISKEEENRRLQCRWNAGMFFASVPEFMKKTVLQTPALSAAAAAKAVTALGNSKI
jgi:hypothetical protein